MDSDEEDQEVGVPEWVVTYGDMMSLLLTFFIMLVSLSELKSDDGATRAMMDAIREAFGPTAGRLGSPGKSLESSGANKELSSQGRRSQGGVKKSGSKAKGTAGAHRTVQPINHGTEVTLGGADVIQAVRRSALRNAQRES